MIDDYETLNYQGHTCSKVLQFLSHLDALTVKLNILIASSFRFGVFDPHLFHQAAEMQLNFLQLH